MCPGAFSHDVEVRGTIHAPTGPECTWGSVASHYVIDRQRLLMPNSSRISFSHLNQIPPYTTLHISNSLKLPPIYNLNTDKSYNTNHHNGSLWRQQQHQ